jgi:predicted AlkP superfamily phosphohydrolase/phosphomutase
MTAPAKVMVIAFDACDKDLATRLAAEGRAPNLAALMERAVVTETAGPVGLYVGSIWPTLVTARQPSRHGYYCWEEATAGGTEHLPTDPRSIDGSPFWLELSRRQRRVAVVDVPHVGVDEHLNGIQVGEWGCHDRHFGFRTSPPELARDLEQRFGLHPVLGLDAHSDRQFASDDEAHRSGLRREPGELRALTLDLLEGVERKTNLSLDLLDRGGWDLFFTVFGEAHAVGHQCWFLHDRDHVRHDPALAAELGDPVTAVYERLDAALGAHLERAGPDTAAFVLFTHGMGAHYDGTLLLEPILRRLDERTSAGDGGSRVANAAKAAWQQVPRAARQRLMPAAAWTLRRRLERGHSTKPSSTVRCGCGIRPPSATEMRSRRAFAVPNNDAHGGIRINVAGRERYGTVDPRDFDAVCDDVTNELLDVVNVDTGERVVEAVVRSSDHYDRAELDTMPDLFVLWNRAHPASTAWSPRVGLVYEPYEGWRTGDHRPGGMLLAQTPWTRPGSLRRTVEIVDLAPTIGSALGVELPDVDGRPVVELVPPSRSGAALSPG